MPDDPEPIDDEVEFEDVVAALLKVDPKGIIGKEGKAERAKPKQPEPHKPKE